MKSKILVMGIAIFLTLFQVNDQIAFSAVNSKSRKELFKLYADSSKVNNSLVRAICKKENPKQNPNLINKNKNGTSDYGLCQVNSKSAKEICNINNPQELLDEETNIWCAVKIFKSKLGFKNSKKHNDNIIRRYNGYDSSVSNKTYTRDVITILAELTE